MVGVAARNSPSELLVARGWWSPVVLRVPLDLVLSETDQQVRLRISLVELLRLRAYVPDADLGRAVREAMRGFLPLHRHGGESIEISVRDGHVALDGPVATSGLRTIAGERAARQQGVLSVWNRLITDADLEGAVAMAFVPHASLQPSLVRVEADLGTVRLEGVLATRALVDLARSLALATPGVVTVGGGLASEVAAEGPDEEVVDWVEVASIESFPASDAPAWPESAERPSRASIFGKQESSV